MKCTEKVELTHCRQDTKSLSPFLYPSTVADEIETLTQAVWLWRLCSQARRGVISQKKKRLSHRPFSNVIFQDTCQATYAPSWHLKIYGNKVYKHSGSVPSGLSDLCHQPPLPHPTVATHKSLAVQMMSEKLQKQKADEKQWGASAMNVCTQEPKCWLRAWCPHCEGTSSCWQEALH